MVMTMDMQHAYVGVDESGRVHAVAWPDESGVITIAREVAAWRDSVTPTPCSIEHARTFRPGDPWQPERPQTVPPLLALMGVES